VRKILAALLLATLVAAPANAGAVVAKGIHGESIAVPTKSLKSGTLVTVTGTHFDESVGIYLAFCVLPVKGALPTPCGGGANKAGIGDASFWISSNPPPYGKGLAIPYNPGGRFTQKLLISRFIGKNDCKKIKCAITVRADHLMSQDRSYDLFIPVVIK
jgi:hypothetical protein